MKSVRSNGTRPAAATTQAPCAMRFAPGDGLSRVCGVDEAGRGPLAGPVYAAAVILDPARPIAGLRDSKQLSAAQRCRLAEQIRSCALAWRVASASVAEIDRLNILQATMLAMQRAVQGLVPAPALALVDGNRAPRLECEVRVIVQGDRLEPAISAASILAKTERDACLERMALQFPQYGFERHKGYPTAEHLALLRRFGPCDEHRRSFQPVREAQLTLDGFATPEPSRIRRSR